jgi:hypothetical protein
VLTGSGGFGDGDGFGHFVREYGDCRMQHAAHKPTKAKSAVAKGQQVEIAWTAACFIF